MIKKKDLMLIVISLVIICINNVALSKYDYVANRTVQSEIAKAVFVLEKDEILEKQIDQSSFPIEYNFTINNFEDDKINEIDFEYIIEVDVSTDNFPVSYFLFDCDNNTEIQLIDGKTNPISLQKFEKESRKFKLYLQWRELDSDLAGSLGIKLKINAVQSKGGEINENKANSNNSNT